MSSGTGPPRQSQLHSWRRSASARSDVLKYAIIKFGLVLLVLEAWTHTVYSNALVRGVPYRANAFPFPFHFR